MGWEIGEGLFFSLCDILVASQAGAIVGGKLSDLEKR